MANQQLGLDGLQAIHGIDDRPRMRTLELSLEDGDTGPIPIGTSSGPNRHQRLQAAWASF